MQSCKSRLTDQYSLLLQRTGGREAREGVFIMFFSEKEKGLNNNYRSAGRGGGGTSKRIIQYMKKKSVSSYKCV